MPKTRRAPKVRDGKRSRVRRVELLESRQLLATITVNTTTDTNTNTTLSLRQAIEIADGTLAPTGAQVPLVVGAVGATNTIVFNIPQADPGFNPVTGVWTIQPASALPTISTHAAFINGYSQTGAQQNTAAQSDNAVIKIAIDGTGLGTVPGLNIASAGSEVSGLDIKSFQFNGIEITGDTIQVAGCFIGTNPAGEVPAPNATGVSVQGSNNTIGGANLGDRNIISGNTGDGINIPVSAGSPFTGNLVTADFIGIDAAGTTALGNGTAGVRDLSTGNTYGSPLIGNVISGNGSGGIKAAGSITVQQSNIGTNAAGTAALGNGPAGTGVQDTAFPSTQTITTKIIGNIISGNHQFGIDIGVGDQATSTYTITGNQIGTDVTGSVALGNTGAGVSLESVENTTFTGNQVSGNIGSGIQLSGFGPGVEHNVFQGNKIGTNFAGTAALGNTGSGILFSNAVGNTIGGSVAGQANVIAFNGAFGINLTSSGGGTATKLVEISENSIFGNTERGIQLGLGGTNNFVTPPTLTYQNGTLTATYTGGPVNQDMLIEVFSNPTAPVAGVEQGKTFVNSFFVTTNGSGNGTASKAEPTAIYTATGTDDSFNTSEFSNAVGGAALPATTTTVTSSANPSTFGQAVTFKAVVAAVGSPDVPAGSVIFTIDGVHTPPITLQNVGGVIEATFTNSTLSLGLHSVVAAYGGDASLSPSSGSLFPNQLVVPPVLPATTTTVTSSLNPSTFGQSVTFKAVVAAVGSQVVPTGSVIFTINGISTPSIPLTDVGGVIEATFTNTALPVGSLSVSAAYSGSVTLAPSGGTLPTQTVSRASTGTIVTSNLNPSTTGQAVTFTADVSSGVLFTFPTGTVVFTIDGHAEPPVPLTLVGELGQAEFTTSTLAAGAHSVSAAYGGNAVFAPSGGALPTEVVNASSLTATTTAVTSSVNPSTFGQSVTFQAVVSETVVPGAAPAGKVHPDQATTGTVTFVIDGVAEPAVPLTNLGLSGVATFTISTLTVGQHSVSASYSGSSTLAPSTGSLPTETVVAAASSVVLTAAPNPSSFGDQVVLTATVTSATGGKVGGTVAFDKGTTVLGFAPVGPGGRATLALSSLPLGLNAITAVYSGDAGHSPAESNTVVQNVEPASNVGPMVLALRRYGFHAQPTILTLAFNAALEMISAENVNNYRIALLNRFGRPVQGHTIRVREAIYDPATSSVTLIPAQRLDIHYRYQLTVNGTTSTGVRGASGLLIDGAGTGQPGSDYVAVIDRTTLAGPIPRVSSKLEAASVATRSSSAALDRLAVSGELAALASRRRGW